LSPLLFCSLFFSFNFPVSAHLSTLSLHDALPIFQFYGFFPRLLLGAVFGYLFVWSRNISIPIFAHFLNNFFVVSLSFYYTQQGKDRKSTRLNSSHVSISYAVFCLKKKIMNVNYYY